jgi:ankyrin repeat protein
MQDLPEELTSLILPYLSDATIFALTILTTTAADKIKRSLDNPVYWHLKTELLLKHSLNFQQIDWKKLYISLKDITTTDPELYSKLTSLSKTDAIKVMIEIEIKPTIHDGNNAIQNAARLGSMEIIEILVKNGVDAAANNNSAIINASAKGYYNVVKFLLTIKKVDPSAQNNISFWNAVENGYIELVDLFLQDGRINSGTKSPNGLYAIEIASYKGYAGIVELLLKDDRIDPSINNNLSLKYAVNENRYRILELLLADSRTDPSVLAIDIDLQIISDKKMLDLLLGFEKIIPKLSKIPIIYKNELIDSLKGIAISYYYLGLQFSDSYIRHYFTNPEGQFYDSILRYIVLKKPTDIQIINYLNNIVINNNINIILSYVAKNTLNGIKCNQCFQNTQLELYEALMGLFLVFYRPKYTYTELLKLIDTDTQGGKMAIILIGAYMGYDDILFQQRDDIKKNEIIRFANQTDNLTRLP